MHYEVDVKEEDAGRVWRPLRDEDGGVVRVANPVLARRERIALRHEGRRTRVLRVNGRSRRQVG